MSSKWDRPIRYLFQRCTRRELSQAYHGGSSVIDLRETMGIAARAVRGARDSMSAIGLAGHMHRLGSAAPIHTSTMADHLDVAAIYLTADVRSSWDARLWAGQGAGPTLANLGVHHAALGSNQTPGGPGTR